jgi:hypothetical protein
LCWARFSGRILSKYQRCGGGRRLPWFIDGSCKQAVQNDSRVDCLSLKASSLLGFICEDGLCLSLCFKTG